MKLYNFMQDLIHLHRKCCKNGIDTTHQFGNYIIEMSENGINIVRNFSIKCGVTPSLNLSAITMSILNDKINHRNNSIEFSYGSSSFFRMSSGTEMVLQSLDRSKAEIEVPRYNDNEDELLFTMSTVTASFLQVILASIFLTLDTKLSTLYTYCLTEKEIDDISDVLKQASTWITSNTAT